MMFLTAMNMYKLELGVFIYRFSINDLPLDFKQYFTERSEIHGYPTRHTHDLNLTSNKKSFSNHAFHTTGPILWNSLPNTLKESKTVRVFRNQLTLNLFKIIINFDF